MNKKNHVLIKVLILAFILLTSYSCGRMEESLNDDYQSGTDHQFFMTANFSPRPKIQETEKGCVCYHEGFIYYYEQGGSIMPLCSKGNCLHDQEKDADKRKECSAFLEDADGMDISLMLYKNCIYISYSRKITEVNEDRVGLYRINLDGSSKDIIFTCPSMEFPVIHRGYLYYFKQEFQAGAEISSQISLYRRNIEDNQHKEEVIYEPEGAHGCSGIQAYGKRLYLTMVRNRTETMFSVYDIETGKITESPYEGRLYTAFGGKTYWLPYDHEKNYQALSDLYQCDEYGENESIVIKNIPQGSILKYDGRYYYLDNAMISHEDPEVENKVRVYDEEFVLKDEFSLPSTDTYLYDTPIGGAKYQHLIFDDSETEEWGLYVWDKEEIGQLNGRSYSQQRICYEKNANTVPKEKRVIDGVVIPETSLDEAVSVKATDERDIYITDLDQWTEKKADEDLSHMETYGGELSVSFTRDTVSAVLKYASETQPVQTDITIGESIKKTILLDSYYIKNKAVFKYSQTITAINTPDPDEFVLGLPEGGEEFIGVTARVNFLDEREHEALEDIRAGRPSAVRKITGSIGQVAAGRVKRKE